ncbi:hypothetical protein [uncultured Tissierella sp.]|uniref:hypothetical protein n=1 Tax=uncultured Tissierella sp. TaxID=448160 RepID=UPI002805043A|nr:hypothetical protein [uncultured Tissierella sp.]MDU5080208.1 hypothetical protein [Bacillota bacterium]
MDSSSIQEIISKYNPNVTGAITDDEISLSSKSWKKDLYFYLDEDTDIEKFIEDFFILKYIPRLGCYMDNYIEFMLSTPYTFFQLSFEGYNVPELECFDDKIYYEISGISDHLFNIIRVNEKYNDDFIESLRYIATIKIYNVNDIKKISIDDVSFIEVAKNTAKNLLFDLSYKHSLVLTLEELPNDFEVFEDFEDYDPVFELAETMVNIKDNYIKKSYDSDLINYYYRANKMDDSEFKYTAYYQVLECIFDEVYLHETVQDIKQIINSSWFSSYDDENIVSLINVVEQYNKNKNDREKLKLVLEKYFKGDSHDEAFFLSNQDIIDILINKLKKISRKEELKDLQKIATIIYDYRCNCTHSNREYPFRTTFTGDYNELNNYIELIKKVSERIIINYNNY